MMPELTATFIAKTLKPRLLKKIAILTTQKVKEAAPKDIGFLRDSIDYEIHGNTITIGARALYAPNVEYGRNPGKMPPVEALEGWARRHGMAGAEWAIAKKIQKHGTPAQPFLRPTVFKSKPLIKKLIKEEFT